MTDETTDEFTREELEKQIAETLPDREAMSILPIPGTEGSFADLDLQADDQTTGTPTDEPLKGPQPMEQI